MYPELIKSPISDGKKYYLKKRPGITSLFQLPAGQAQGIYNWKGNYYTAIGGFVYVNGSNTPLITLSQSGTTVGFCEWASPTDDRLIVADGNAAWAIGAGNTVTAITAIPHPHVPTPVALDGYLFIPTANSQQLNNSALNDFSTWPVDGFIDAEMFPDNIVGLARVQNYIAVIGTMSIEWMYDNANATGSPLQRNAPAVSQFGCPAPLTINQTELELILVGTTSNGGRTVWVVNGFQPSEIGSEPIREALDLEGSSISGAYAYTIQSAGHKWYVLSLTSAQRTFVYDFEEQMWHEWTSGTSQSAFQWMYSTDTTTGTPALLNVSTGLVGQLIATSYQDLTTPINCIVITSKIDFDTIMRKRFYRLSLIGDSPNGDVNTPVTVQWSDDDYNTWVTYHVPLEINGSYPTITQLGYSRRRAFQFNYQQNFPLRLEAFEVDIIQEVRR